MKKILLLGGSFQQVVAIKKAKELGYYTVLCDYLSDNPGQYEADKFYLVSTTDKNAVLNVALKEQVDGVLAYASDPAAPTAAYVAEKLGLPTNPYKSVETLCNKSKFRKFLKENGFNTPKSKSYLDIDDVLIDLNNGFYNYPLIVKPVDSSGSKGVSIVKDSSHFNNAYKYASEFSRTTSVIVEEYIEKEHKYIVGGDIIVIDGKIVIWGLFNCHRDNAVNPLVPIGKSYPLDLPNESLLLIQKELQRLISELSIKNGEFNIELIINKNRVFFIDIGPRAGGNMIPDLLSDIYGVDAVKTIIHLAMGNEVHFDFENNNDSYFLTLNIYSKYDGILNEIKIDEEIKKYLYRECYYKAVNDRIEIFTYSSKTLGILFFRFYSKAEFDKYKDCISEYVEIELL